MLGGTGELDPGGDATRWIARAAAPAVKSGHLPVRTGAPAVSLPACLSFPDSLRGPGPTAGVAGSRTWTGVGQPGAFIHLAQTADR